MIPLRSARILFRLHWTGLLACLTSRPSSISLTPTTLLLSVAVLFRQWTSSRFFLLRAGFAWALLTLIGILNSESVEAVLELFSIDPSKDGELCTPQHYACDFGLGGSHGARLAGQGAQPPVQEALHVDRGVGNLVASIDRAALEAVQCCPQRADELLVAHAPSFQRGEARGVHGPDPPLG